jgi:hypothetical protein
MLESVRDMSIKRSRTFIKLFSLGWNSKVFKMIFPEIGYSLSELEALCESEPSAESVTLCGKIAHKHATMTTPKIHRRVPFDDECFCPGKRGCPKVFHRHNFKRTAYYCKILNFTRGKSLVTANAIDCKASIDR